MFVNPRIQCFSCGGGLNDRDDNNAPWKQHARWLNHFRFVKLIKGQIYTSICIYGIAAQNVKAAAAVEEKSSPPITHASNSTASHIKTPSCSCRGCSHKCWHKWRCGTSMHKMRFGKDARCCRFRSHRTSSAISAMDPNTIRHFYHAVIWMPAPNEPLQSFRSAWYPSPMSCVYICLKWHQ